MLRLRVLRLPPERDPFTILNSSSGIVAIALAIALLFVAILFTQLLLLLLLLPLLLLPLLLLPLLLLPLLLFRLVGTNSFAFGFRFKDILLDR